MSQVGYETQIEVSHSQDISRNRRANLVPLLGCSALGLIGGAAIFAGSLSTSSTETEIGGNRVIVQPALDGRATVDGGILSIRTGKLNNTYGLGVSIELKEGSGSVQNYVDKTSKVFGKPYETIVQISDVVKGQAMRSAVWGVVGGITLGASAFYLRRSINRTRWLAGGVAAVSVAGLFAATRTDIQTEPAEWNSLAAFVPERYRADILKNVPTEIQSSEIRGTLDGQSKIINDFVEEKFVKPQAFVTGAWNNFLTQQADYVPEKQTDDYRVGIISDLHDNTFMADLAGKTLQAFRADALIVAGDTTSSGSKYEQFSGQAIIDATKNIKDRADIIGNHDSEDSEQPFRKSKFLDLNDGTLKDMGPLRVLGVRSNQKTVLGRDTVDIGPPNDEVAQALADEACSQDKGVDLTVVHEPVLGDRVALQGCSEIVVAGHMHDQVSPTSISNENGTSVFRMINGTTGGAESAFTFGEPINPADITVLTYKIDDEGEATFSGWQHVRYFRSGRVEMTSFTSVLPARTHQDLEQVFVEPVNAKKSLQ